MTAYRARMHRSVAVAAALAFVVGTAAPAGASDKSDAKKLVVTKADVDPEFTAQKDTSNTDHFAQVAKCVGKPVPDRKVTARVVGPMLVEAQRDLVITSSFTVVKTAKMARDDRKVLESDDLPDCVARLAEDQGAENVEAQRAKVGDFGDYATAVLASYRTQGGDFTAVEVGIISGRGELDATFTAAGDEPFNRADAEDILDQVAQRMKAADL